MNKYFFLQVGFYSNLDESFLFQTNVVYCTLSEHIIKAQCISIFFSERFNNKLYFPSTYLNGSLSWQDSLQIYKVTFDFLLEHSYAS